jgi:hypothetical protein
VSAGIDVAALMVLRARTLFLLDGEGHLIGVNDPAAGAPPRVYVSRSREGTAVYTSAGLPGELRAALEDAARALPPFDPAAVPATDLATPLVRLLEAHAPVVAVHQGPAFAFTLPPFPSMGAVQIYPGNASLLHPALATLGPELGRRRPCFAVMRGGAAVSVCYSARSTPEAAEAGVETADEFRGQGCAGLAVEAWAANVRETKRRPFYSTSWENAASLAVARKLGLALVGEDLHIT